MNGLFVTGTDTGCGKTFVSAGLLRALGAIGVRATGMKPVASGVETDASGQTVNADVEALRAAAPVTVPAAACNPYLFLPPASPHIVAAEAGVTIRLERVLDAYATCREAADFVVVEGVGGWCVPLGDALDVADLARALQLPVVLVVALRLGCINHALLSTAAIAASGLPLLGWVANRVEPDLYAPQAVMATLEQRIEAPCLAVLDWNDGRALDPLARRIAAGIA